MPNISCADDNGEPMGASKHTTIFTASCSLANGLICKRNNQSSGHCPDFSVRYTCTCPTSTSTPSVGAKSTQAKPFTSSPLVGTKYTAGKPYASTLGTHSTAGKQFTSPSGSQMTNRLGKATLGTQTGHHITDFTGILSASSEKIIWGLRPV